MAPPSSKQPPNNPFRQHQGDGVPARRSIKQVACFAVGVGLISLGLLSSLSSPGRHPVEAPQQGPAAPKSNGGLRSISSNISPSEQVNEKPTGITNQKLHQNQWDSEEDEIEDEDENHVDPEDQAQPNKRIGETKQVVQKEHVELQGEVEGHIFGQNRTEEDKVEPDAAVVSVPEVRGVGNTKPTDSTRRTQDDSSSGSVEKIMDPIVVVATKQGIPKIAEAATER